MASWRPQYATMSLMDIQCNHEMAIHQLTSVPSFVGPRRLCWFENIPRIQGLVAKTNYFCLVGWGAMKNLSEILSGFPRNGGSTHETKFPNRPWSPGNPWQKNPIIHPIVFICLIYWLKPFWQTLTNCLKHSKAHFSLLAILQISMSTVERLRSAKTVLFSGSTLIWGRVTLSRCGVNVHQRLVTCSERSALSTFSKRLKSSTGISCLGAWWSWWWWWDLLLHIGIATNVIILL